MGKEAKYSFSLLKDSSASSVCLNLAYLRDLKNGKHLSVDLDMNLSKAATLGVNYCTSFIDLGDFIESMDFI